MSINDISTLSPHQIDVLFEVVLRDLEDSEEKTLRNNELSSLEREYSTELSGVQLTS